MMKTNAVLVNGVSLPFHVYDACVKQMDKTSDHLSVIFVFEHRQTKKEYKKTKLPSIVSFTNKSAHAHLSSLINNNAAFTTGYFKRLGMEVQVDILRNPSLQEIETAVSSAESIFLDPKSYEQPKDSVNLSVPYKIIEDTFGGRIRPCKK